MDTKISPWAIKRPCSADWEKMRGDDKRRFCEHCQKFVHNVSAMSKAEREAFVSPEGIKECIWYSTRSNGQIADFSFLAKMRRWFPVLRLVSWSALLAILPVVLTGCMGVRLPKQLTPMPDKQESASEATKIVDQSPDTKTRE